MSIPPDNPKKLIRLLDLAPKISTREGFIDEYFERLSDHPSNGDAYWSVEHDHMSVFGRTRYNGHENFASVLSRWNANRREPLAERWVKAKKRGAYSPSSPSYFM